MSKVSVFILTCNRPEWARQALTSVLKQTFTDFTVLVRDNSTDDSIEELVASFDDPRITYHRGFPRGQLPNLTGALQECGGDIIVPMHDDDWWEPNLLESIVGPMLADESIDLAFAALEFSSEVGSPMRRLTTINNKDRYRGVKHGLNDFTNNRTALADWMLVRTGLSPFQGCGLRRKFLKDLVIPPQAGQTADLWICYHLWPQISKVYFDSRALVHYRIHGGNVAGQRAWELLDNDVWCVQKMLNDPSLVAVYPALQRRINVNTLSVAYGKLGRRDLSTTRDKLKEIAPRLTFTRRIFNMAISRVPARPLAQAYLRTRNLPK